MIFRYFLLSVRKKKQERTANTLPLSFALLTPRLLAWQTCEAVLIMASSFRIGLNLLSLGIMRVVSSAVSSCTVLRCRGAYVRAVFNRLSALFLSIVCRSPFHLHISSENQGPIQALSAISSPLPAHRPSSAGFRLWSRNSRHPRA